MNLVALPLAHPLMPDQAERVGATEVRMYGAGETVIVPAAGAMTVIRAGLAQVDPNDPKAVTAALAVTPDAAAAGGAMTASAPAAATTAPQPSGTDASGT